MKTQNILKKEIVTLLMNYLPQDCWSIDGDEFQFIVSSDEFGRVMKEETRFYDCIYEIYYRCEYHYQRVDKEYTIAVKL